MNKSHLQGRSSMLSPESNAWLTAALDPFHDFQYDLEGMPDQRSAPSVIQMHNQSFTLTTPSSAGAGNWDASIIFTGINTPIGFPQNRGGMLTTAATSSIHVYDPASLSSGTAFGALNIWAGASGSTMSTGAPHTVGDTFDALGSVATTDRCRLISAGFEIHNTTASIYKQGSLTVAQLPDHACDSGTILYTNGESLDPVDTWVQADRACKQASSLPYLLQVPGSQTWPAEKGVYAIPRLVAPPQDIVSYLYNTDIGSGAFGAMSRVPILYGTDGKSATPEPSGGVSDGRVVAQFKPMAPNYFSPIQVWLSGLSSETALTITFRTVVEYFPALDSPLLPIASPSPAFDPYVLELYSRLVCRAPYAVPVGQNAAGDYFRKIASLIASVLKMSAPAFGEFAPLAYAAGSAGQMLLEKRGQRIDRSGAGPAARVTKKR